MKFAVRIPLVALTMTVVAGPGADARIRVELTPTGWTTSGKAVKADSSYSALAEFAGTKDSSDLLLDCGDSGKLAYTCTQEHCRVPACSTRADGVTVHVIRQPSTPAETSSPGSMFTSFLRREPKPLAVMGVRGVGDPNDAVLLKDGDAIHWGLALKGVSEGQYCFRLAALPRDSSSAGIVFNLGWDRSSDAEGVAQIPKVAPGLYLLEKGKAEAGSTCGANPEAVAAWVLILGEPDFSRVAKSWKNYAPELRELSKSGASEALRLTVSHAALAYLSDSK